MREVFEKFLAVVLSVCILMATLPSNVYANVTNTVENDLETNTIIKNELSQATTTSSAISGDDVLLKLMDLGLLKGTGKLVSMNIVIDGEVKTLEEAKAIVTAVGVNLSQTIEVEGETITLEELKKIIEIEEELARIETDFLGGNSVTITDAHRDALDTLIKQFNSEGITVTKGSESLIFAGDTLERGVEVSVTNYNYTDDYRQIYIDFSVNKPQTTDITFKAELIDSTLDITNNTTTVSIPAGRTSYRAHIGFNLNTNRNYYYGNGHYLLQLIDIENATFVDEKSNMSLDCWYGGNYDYKGKYEWVSNNVRPLGSSDLIHLNHEYWEDDNNDNVVDAGGQEVNNKECFDLVFTRLFNRTSCLNDGHKHGNRDLYLDYEQYRNDFVKLFDDGVITHLKNPALRTWDGFNVLHGANKVELNVYNGDNNHLGTYYLSEWHRSGGYLLWDSFDMNRHIPLKNEYKRDGDNQPINYRTDINDSNLIFKVKHALDYHDGALNVQLLDNNGLAPRDFINPTYVNTYVDTSVTYKKGSKIPVVVEYSEPVMSINKNHNYGRTRLYYILGNGTEQYVESNENQDYQGRKLSFNIPVESYFMGLKITGIAPCADVAGNTSEGYTIGRNFGVGVQAPKEAAFTDYIVTNDDNNITLSCILDIANEEFASWVISEAQKNNNANVIDNLRAVIVNERAGRDYICY